MRFLPSRRAEWIRISAMLAVPALAAGAFLLWQPGERVTDGRHDRGNNGVFLGDGWLTAGEDLLRKPETVPLYQQFHDTHAIEGHLSDLRSRNMLWLFPHLGPCTADGDLPPYANTVTQTFGFISGARGQHVLPWVGGTKGEGVRWQDPKWRQTFCAACAKLVERNNLLEGVLVHVEPWPDGDADGLKLLEELRAALPKDKKLAVAACPPPTVFQRSRDTQWGEPYFRQVAQRCDLMVPMLYGTGLPSRKLYVNLTRQWTKECLAWAAPTPVLLAVPAYDQEQPGHRPQVESLQNALRGVHAGLGDGPPPANYQGLALFADFSATPAHWQTWKDEFQDAKIPVPKVEKVPSPLDGLLGQ